VALDVRPALRADNGYIGTYANDYYGTIEVAATDGGLELLLGPDKMNFPLTHYDRDTFTYETVGENASGRTGVSFSLDGVGSARSVWIEALDNTGIGTFARTQ
jgi:hypothetical protein